MYLKIAQWSSPLHGLHILMDAIDPSCIRIYVHTYINYQSPVSTFALGIFES